MENANEKRLFFKSIYVDLKSVNYEKLDDQNDNNEQIKIVTNDFHNVFDISAKGFKILYTRNVELDPKILFEIKVSYEISYEFDDKTIKEYKDNIEELKELINIKAEKAINMTGVVSRASALISCITLQNNGNALVTQPNYSKSK